MAAVLVLLASGLSGCALSKLPPTSKIQQDALPPTAKVPAAYTADPAANGEVANDWLKSFQDRQLDTLVAEAMANNPDLRSAAVRVEIAKENVVLVGSQLKPWVGLTAGARTTRDADHSSNFFADKAIVGVSWEPDIWGKIRSQKEAAAEGYAATALNFSWARQSLAATTSKGWFQLVALQQLLGLQTEAIRIFEQLLALAKVKREYGQVSDLDVQEAMTRVANAQNELRALEGLYSASRRGLEVLVGRYPSASMEVASQFTPLPPPLQAGLPSTLLERRPDVAAAERAVLQAFRAKESARLALLPSFVLTADGGRFGDQMLSVLQLNPWYYSLAALVNVPIYTGGALQSQLKIATLQQQQAVAEYGNVALNAFREVEVALTQENLYGQRLEYSQEALRSSTEAVRIANTRYQAGAADMLTVLQLTSAQLAAQSEVIKLRSSLLTNRVTLHLALGGSFNQAAAATIAK